MNSCVYYNAQTCREDTQKTLFIEENFTKFIKKHAIILIYGKFLLSLRLD